jgi:hypothetical protein
MSSLSILNFWNVSIIRLMEKMNLDMEKCELLLTFLGQQKIFYRVFIVKQKRELLFNNIKQILECDDSTAWKLVEV